MSVINKPVSLILTRNPNSQSLNMLPSQIKLDTTIEPDSFILTNYISINEPKDPNYVVISENCLPKNYSMYLKKDKTTNDCVDETKKIQRMYTFNEKD